MSPTVRQAALTLANRLLPSFPKHLPVILAMHALPDAAAFEDRLDHIDREHRTVVPLRDVVRWMRGQASLPPSPLVLTFDDGYHEHWALAKERLLRRGWPATFFVTSRHLGGMSDWAKERSAEAALPLMDSTQVRDLASSGFEIGCHSATHPHLSQLDGTHLQQEVAASREALEAVAAAPVFGFCYPYGDWSPAVRQAVIDAGYEYAAGTQLDAARPGGDVWLLPRISPPDVTVGPEFDAYVIGTAKPWLKLRRAVRQVLGRS